jgi:hypothetical protein
MLHGPAGWWLAAGPVILAAAAYWWILGIWFDSDDFIHLYDLANLGPLGFAFKGQGGHAYVVRNTVFWLTHALFDLHAEGFMATVLLTHLLNVFLCYRVGRGLSGDPYAASAAAALWAVAPSAAGTLGWYSVFGQVLATTVLLVILLSVSRRAADARPVTTQAVLGWLILSWIGGFCFGTGLGVALVMPAVIALFVPAALERAATRGVLIMSPMVVVALYVGYLVVGARWETSATDVLPLYVKITQNWPDALELFLHLMLRGPADLLVGPFVRVQPSLLTGGVVVLALVVLVARLPGRQRRQAAALCLTTCAAYGMIAVGRGLLLTAVMDAQRYHYQALAPLALLLAVVVAACAAEHGSPAWRRALVLAWMLLLAIGVAYRGRPAPRDDEAKQRELNDIRTAIETAMRATPDGAAVYIQNRPYQGAGLLVGFPQFFPGWAAVYCILNAENSVEGRVVRFVEERPAVRRGSAVGRCGAELLVAAAPPGATVW